MLNDITTRDRSLEKDVIHSLSIINGDVASIVMSYKDQKCQLERYSNRTPNFFGYSNEEFKVIKNPEPFIPDVIAVYHNYYVGRIVREGNPKILRRYRQLVAKSKNGYLFPVKLFADYFFNIHDTLCFSALVLKLQTSCEYILVEHDGYIQGFSEGFFNFLRETSKCYDLDPNLLMQVNIKIVFPTLLEFLNKYDENGITPNMTNHFTMEIPLIKIYPDLDDEENKGHIKYVSEYYQILKSEDYINNNKEATYGFFFFNQIENGGFNFLNTNFGGKKLNRFLNNIDGIIVIMSGEENYFLGNDKIIKDNPQIKKWYSIGLYDVGSYGSLLYLSQMKDKLDGAIVIDPNYMQMIDYYSTLIDLNKYNNTNIFDYINKDRELFKQKDILIIEAENSKQQQHTDNLASSTNSHIIRYNSSKYKNNDDKIESLLFSNIEQFISQMNKNLLKK